MFKRRVPKTLLRKLRDFFWPRLGWRRSGRLYALKLSRLQGSAAAVAAGFACGAAMSILPMVGFHFLLAAMAAWVVRGNLIASAIGTVVGNPWTFPFIWVASWHTGNFLLGGRAQSVHHLDFTQLFNALWQGVVSLDGQLLMQSVWPVWWPMFVGSLPWAVIVWFLFYLPIKRVLASYERMRAMRRLERLAALTGQPAGGGGRGA